MNVDNSFLGRTGHACIWWERERGRGVFRDFEENVPLRFSKKVSVDLMMHVVLLTVRKGILVVVVSRLASSHSLLFESNFQSVVT